MDKICYTCKICKPFSDFHKDKKMKDGIKSQCKICSKLKDKLYRNKQKNCVVYRLEYKKYYYIGSTDNFKNRFIKHKSNCFNINSTKYNFKIYKKFRELGLLKDIFYNDLKHTIILENLDKSVLKETENDYINLDDEFCLNSKNENTLKGKEYKKEYYETHKERIKEQNKQYRQNNKEEIKKYNKKYYENNKK